MIFIKSVFIGIFAIFPGISGSALAISLDIYDKTIYSLKNIKENKLFLLSVMTGLITGIIIGSNIIIYISNFKNILYYIFIGLIIGDIPFMIKKTRDNGRMRYIPLLCSFVFSVFTFLFYKNLLNKKVTFIKMIIGGILFSFGKVFPGVSSSFFLIILGIYNKIIICFSNPIVLFLNFNYYLPFIIGVILGLLLSIKLLNYLLKNKYDYLYSALLGFILSSIISVFPKFDLIGVFLMVMSFIISFKIRAKKC